MVVVILKSDSKDRFHGISVQRFIVRDRKTKIIVFGCVCVCVEGLARAGKGWVWVGGQEPDSHPQYYEHVVYKLRPLSHQNVEMD